MKLFRLLALAAAIATIASAAPALVLIVRHAEREAVPADDPPLTAAGRRRAEELVRVVRAWSATGVTVRALFASEVKRTHETLEPLAAAIGMTISTVAAKDTAALLRRILAVDGGIVVVAGHSNTVPAIAQALGGPTGIALADAEFDRLFAVTGVGAHAEVISLRYGAR